MLLCALIVLSVISSTLQLDEKCLDHHTDCNSVDYESYKNCVRRRQRRSTDCGSDCNDCECQSCNYSNCNDSCNSCCSQCCSNYIPCGTNDCCQKTCKSQCNSPTCRRNCTKNCHSIIKINYEKNNSIIAKNNNKINLTTVIHLTNVINNTNHIDVPIQLNTTNVQNITLEQSNGPHQSNCCTVIGPRQCVPINEIPFIRCFHQRSKLCGELCTGTILHKEQRQVCQSVYPGVAPRCEPKIVYVPQPQPKCRYESTWPYVSCGVKKSASCDGCYSTKQSKTYMACPSECYDAGFEGDPFYRRGPFYRRPFGGGGLEPYGYGGYGGFGRQPPYGTLNGGPPPPPYIDFSFENTSPGGFGRKDNSFEPGVSSRKEESSSDSINVGPSYSNALYDGFRNIREIEVETNDKSRPEVERKLRKDEVSDESKKLNS